MRSCMGTAVAAFALAVAAASASGAPTRSPLLGQSASGLDASGSQAPPAANASSPDTVQDQPSDPALLDADRQPTGVAAELAAWVAASNDNAGLPFMIVDKLGAEVFAYDATGQLLGQAPVLVGLARGDDSAAGIGDLALSAISPDERTTPAGRFVARFGPSEGHGTVLWVDYADAISMHPVITTNPAEHRLQRIRSSAPEDHRISFGCINVPATFYHDVVQKDRDGVVVYILPDTKPVADIFPAFAAADRIGADDAASSSQDRCGDPLQVPDRIPDPDPSLLCPAGDPEPPGATAAR
ncbi:MAG TPA: hypothetical protein VMU37_00885 [Caulobacteraceae bacterium]|nr:hypothetical protein [Caulobacteraceae bacterium]